MKKGTLITFFNRTSDQLLISFYNLLTKFSKVEIERKYQNGFYSGWFLVSK